jgi:hypothetical protein
MEFFFVCFRGKISLKCFKGKLQANSVHKSSMQTQSLELEWVQLCILFLVGRQGSIQDGVTML